MEKRCQKTRFTAAAFLGGPPSFERDKHGRDVASFVVVARVVTTSSGEQIQSSWCSCFRVWIWNAELVEVLRWRDFAAADRINVSGRFLAEDHDADDPSIAGECEDLVTQCAPRLLKIEEQLFIGGEARTDAGGSRGSVAILPANAQISEAGDGQ